MSDGAVEIQLQPVGDDASAAASTTPDEAMERLSKAKSAQEAKEAIVQLQLLLDDSADIREGRIQQADVIRASKSAKAELGDDWPGDEFRELLYRFAD